jgi:hypothetical protein
MLDMNMLKVLGLMVITLTCLSWGFVDLVSGFLGILTSHLVMNAPTLVGRPSLTAFAGFFTVQLPDKENR